MAPTKELRTARSVPNAVLHQIYLNNYQSLYKQVESQFRIEEGTVSSFVDVLVGKETTCTVFQRSSILGAAPFDATSVFFPILHEGGRWSLIVVLVSLKCVLHFRWARVDDGLARQLEDVSSDLAVTLLICTELLATLAIQSS